MKSFEKDKSPGPNGCPVEFFLGFFDLVGGDLLPVVESSRVSRRVDNSLNSTFISLIPKEEKPLSFADFRPISLCNLVYKLISKIAALRLKPFLDKSISPEQFGFLRHMQIVEPIGITHKALHTLKTKKNSALVLKLDLVKAFDRVN